MIRQPVKIEITATDDQYHRWSPPDGWYFARSGIATAARLESTSDIEQLAADLVDELMSGPGPTRAEAIEYAVGMLTAVAKYHGRKGNG